ncbi:MAG: Maf family protein [Rhodospirillaceae bacterium]
MTAGASSRIVLASGSSARAAMLRGAGLDPVIDPADIDERAVEASCRADGDATDAVAVALARAKALAVSARHAGAMVIGADQMMDCGGKIFHKPADLAQARETLVKLQGRDHRLVSGMCLARDGAVLWHYAAVAVLTMRALDTDAIDRYLDAAGAGVLASVGAYRLEETGSQLFDRIEGDYFTILGLPLLPLLAALRDQTPPPDGLLS